MLHDLIEFFLIPVQFFQRAGKQHYAAIGVGLFIAALYFGIFFRGVSGFVDDLEKSGKVPLVHKHYDHVEAKWSHSKVMIWICLSVGSGVLAFYQLPGWFPRWFPE